jgi:hypothetical protein
MVQVVCATIENSLDTIISVPLGVELQLGQVCLIFYLELIFGVERGLLLSTLHPPRTKFIQRQ